MRGSLPTGGPHLGALPRGGVGIDGERQLPEVAREDDTILAAGRFDRDVLVEHVVEHAVGRTVQRIAPAAAAAVVVLVGLAGVVLDVGGALPGLVRVLTA